MLYVQRTCICFSIYTTNIYVLYVLYKIVDGREVDIYVRVTMTTLWKKLCGFWVLQGLVVIL